MKLYSYVVTHDTGFAPNPFHGYCTLACCKPDIRRAIGNDMEAEHDSKSKRNDFWIVGLSPRDKGKGNKIIYIMKAEEAIKFERYFTTKKYECKKPDVKSGRLIDRCGDNIYRPVGKGRYKQLPSSHSTDPKNGDWSENEKRKNDDLSGEYALISQHFFYFGSNPLDLPPNLSPLIVGRKHRCNYENEHEVHANFMDFVHSLRVQGVTAHPTIWKKGDTSWKRCS